MSDPPLPHPPLRLRHALGRYELYGDEQAWRRFLLLKTAVERHMRVWAPEGTWLSDVHPQTGVKVRNVFESLQAFWPGQLAALGEVEEAGRGLNGAMAVWLQVQLSQFSSWPAAPHGSLSPRTAPVAPQQAVRRAIRPACPA